MKLPSFLALKGAISSVDELSNALGDLDKAKLDAQRELQRLGDMRPGLLVTASNEELRHHDAAMDRCRREIEQAAARIAMLEPEWREADRLAEQARKKVLYGRARKARSEAQKALNDYTVAARGVADILTRYRALSAEIASANTDLPDGAEPIEGVEPFNGRIAQPDRYEPTTELAYVDSRTGQVVQGAFSPNDPNIRQVEVKGRDRWVPGTFGAPHASLLANVNLPAVEPRAWPFWKASSS